MSSLWPTDAMSTCTAHDLEACQGQGTCLLDVEGKNSEGGTGHQESQWGKKERKGEEKEESVKKTIDESNQLVRTRSPWRAFLTLILNSYNVKYDSL